MAAVCARAVQRVGRLYDDHDGDDTSDDDHGTAAMLADAARARAPLGALPAG